MIAYIVTRAHAYTMNRFLEGWGKGLAGRISVVPYEKLLQADTLPRATYIFSDLERLAPQEAEAAAQVWQQLADVRPPLKLLNHPTRTLGRYELQRHLKERGLSGFGVYRLVEARAPARFPVFLRVETDHAGARTPLLGSPQELAAAVEELDRAGRSRETRLVIEFLDTADGEGVYRKYSAFMVGGRVVARHLFFSRQWMLKYADLAEEHLLREEMDYVQGNPHVDLLRPIFELARIDYGRIDYSLSGGRPQVWEINTNPMLVSPEAFHIPAREPANLAALERLTAAFEAIDEPAGGTLRLTPPRPRPPLKRRLKQAVKLVIGKDQGCN